MKQHLLLILIFFILFSFESKSQTDTIIQFNKPLYNGQIGYVTPNKDTLYVEKNVFQLYNQIWNMPQNKESKPILIMVDTVKPFYSYARKE